MLGSPPIPVSAVQTMETALYAGHEAYTKLSSAARAHEPFARLDQLELLAVRAFETTAYIADRQMRRLLPQLLRVAFTDTREVFSHVERVAARPTNTAQMGADLLVRSQASLLLVARASDQRKTSLFQAGNVADQELTLPSDVAASFSEDRTLVTYDEVKDRVGWKPEVRAWLLADTRVAHHDNGSAKGCPAATILAQHKGVERQTILQRYWGLAAEVAYGNPSS